MLNYRVLLDLSDINNGNGRWTHPNPFIPSERMSIVNEGLLVKERGRLIPIGIRQEP